MKKIATWLWLLNKRLYKKTTFVILLLSIPVLVLALGIVTKESSGILHIVLVQEEKKDNLSEEIIENLLSENRLIRFTECETTEEAVLMVKNGQADSAWIFQADLQQKIDRFVETQSEEDCFVQIIEREKTVPLTLSHEKLCGAVYKYCAKSEYIHFIREQIPQLNHLTESQLMEYYNSIGINEEVFAFSYMDAEESAEDAMETGYLLTPLRGLLAVLVVLGGLATSVFYIQDEQRGTFSWIPQHKRIWIELAYQLISIVNVAVVMLLALILAGVTTSLRREIAMLLLYVICCAVFSMSIRRIFSRVSWLSASMPLMVIMMLAVCPVFFDFKSLRTLQMLLPPTYYINAVHSQKYLVYMIFHILCAGIFCIIENCKTSGFMIRKKGQKVMLV